MLVRSGNEFQIRNSSDKIYFVCWVGSKYTPYFEPLVDGFTTLAMMSLGTIPPNDTKGVSTPPSQSQSSCANTPSQTHFWDTPIGGVSHFPLLDESDRPGEGEDGFIFSSATTEPNKTTLSTDSTTIIVRTKNDVNLMVSPMLLEGLKR